MELRTHSRTSSTTLRRTARYLCLSVLKMNDLLVSAVVAMNSSAPLPMAPATGAGDIGGHLHCLSVRFSTVVWLLSSAMLLEVLVVGVLLWRSHRLVAAGRYDEGGALIFPVSMPSIALRTASTA